MFSSVDGVVQLIHLKKYVALRALHLYSLQLSEEVSTDTGSSSMTGHVVGRQIVVSEDETLVRGQMGRSYKSSSTPT